MSTLHRNRPARQGGVALAILVWFIAAMSLLVGSIVLQARVDIKLAQLHATRARVEAAADGAIQLALAELMLLEREGEYSGSALHYSRHSVGETEVAVAFTPLSGLIDINRAPERLLFLLFSSIEDIEENVAQELAVSVVEWRTADPDDTEYGFEQDNSDSAYQDSTGATGAQNQESLVPQGKFQTVEGLLLVPGVDRRIYEAVRDAVCVSDGGQSGVDWKTAPVSVLQALGAMDQQTALELAGERLVEDGADVAPPQALDLEFQGAEGMSTYRIDAFIEADNVTYRRRRWVNRTESGSNGLPWRFFRTEAVMVASSLEQQMIASVESINAGS